MRGFVGLVAVVGGSLVFGLAGSALGFPDEAIALSAVVGAGLAIWTAQYIDDQETKRSLDLWRQERDIHAHYEANEDDR